MVAEQIAETRSQIEARKQEIIKEGEVFKPSLRRTAKTDLTPEQRRVVKEQKRRGREYYEGVREDVEKQEGEFETHVSKYFPTQATPEYFEKSYQTSISESQRQLDKIQQRVERAKERIKSKEESFGRDLDYLRDRLKRGRITSEQYNKQRQDLRNRFNISMEREESELYGYEEQAKYYKGILGSKDKASFIEKHFTDYNREYANYLYDKEIAVGENRVKKELFKQSLNQGKYENELSKFKEAGIDTSKIKDMATFNTAVNQFNRKVETNQQRVQKISDTVKAGNFKSLSQSDIEFMWGGEFANFVKENPNEVPTRFDANLSPVSIQSALLGKEVGIYEYDKELKNKYDEEMRAESRDVYGPITPAVTQAEKTNFEKRIDQAKNLVSSIWGRVKDIGATVSVAPVLSTISTTLERTRTPLVNLFSTKPVIDYTKEQVKKIDVPKVVSTVRTVATTSPIPTLTPKYTGIDTIGLVAGVGTSFLTAPTLLVSGETVGKVWSGTTFGEDKDKTTFEKRIETGLKLGRYVVYDAPKVYLESRKDKGAREKYYKDLEDLDKIYQQQMELRKKHGYEGMDSEKFVEEFDKLADKVETIQARETYKYFEDRGGVTTAFGEMRKVEGHPAAKIVAEGAQKFAEGLSYLTPIRYLTGASMFSEAHKDIREGRGTLGSLGQLGIGASLVIPWGALRGGGTAKASIKPVSTTMRIVRPTIAVAGLGGISGLTGYSVYKETGDWKSGVAAGTGMALGLGTGIGMHYLSSKYSYSKEVEFAKLKQRAAQQRLKMEQELTKLANKYHKIMRGEGRIQNIKSLQLTKGQTLNINQQKAVVDELTRMGFTKTEALRLSKDFTLGRLKFEISLPEKYVLQKGTLRDIARTETLPGLKHSPWVGRQSMDYAILRASVKTKTGYKEIILIARITKSGKLSVLGELQVIKGVKGMPTGLEVTRFTRHKYYTTFKDTRVVDIRGDTKITHKLIREGYMKSPPELIQLKKVSGTKIPLTEGRSLLTRQSTAVTKSIHPFGKREFVGLDAPKEKLIQQHMTKEQFKNLFKSGTVLDKTKLNEIILLKRKIPELRLDWRKIPGTETYKVQARVVTGYDYSILTETGTKQFSPAFMKYKPKPLTKAELINIRKLEVKLSKIDKYYDFRKLRQTYEGMSGKDIKQSLEIELKKLSAQELTQLPMQKVIVAPAKVTYQTPTSFSREVRVAEKEVVSLSALKQPSASYIASGMTGALIQKQYTETESKIAERAALKDRTQEKIAYQQRAVSQQKVAQQQIIQQKIIQRATMRPGLTGVSFRALRPMRIKTPPAKPPVPRVPKILIPPTVPEKEKIVPGRKIEKKKKKKREYEVRPTIANILYRTKRRTPLRRVTGFEVLRV